MKPRNSNSNQKTRKILLIVIGIQLLALIFLSGWVVTDTRTARAFNDAMEEGNRYLLAMNLEQAEVHFLRAVEIRPREVEPYLRLSDVYMEMDDTQQAIEILEEGIEAVSEEDREILEDRLEEIRGEDSFALSEEPHEMPEIEEHTIVMHLNYEGAESIPPIEVVTGTTVGELPVPVREGFYFMGWTRDMAGTETVTDEMILTEDVELYAQWEAGRLLGALRAYLSYLIQLNQSRSVEVLGWEGRLELRAISSTPYVALVDFDNDGVPELVVVARAEIQAGGGVSYLQVLSYVEQLEVIYHGHIFGSAGVQYYALDFNPGGGVNLVQAVLWDVALVAGGNDQSHVSYFYLENNSFRAGQVVSLARNQVEGYTASMENISWFEGCSLEQMIAELERRIEELEGGR